MRILEEVLGKIMVVFFVLFFASIAIPALSGAIGYPLPIELTVSDRTINIPLLTFSIMGIAGILWKFTQDIRQRFGW